MLSERNNNCNEDESIRMKEDEFIRIKVGDPRSIVKVGDVEVYVNRRFSWFHRIMINLMFGFEVTNINYKGSKK